MTVEAVILDWAGTTVDYGCFAPVQAFIDAFAAKGIDVTIDEVRKPMGMLKRDHIIAMLQMPRIQKTFQKKYGRHAADDDVTELLTIFTEKLMKNLAEGTELKPNALDVYTILKARNIKIGSTTGYTSDMLLPVAKKAAELGYKPDMMVTPDDVNGLGRPHPDMILKNLEALGITDLTAVIKVGDTVSDIEEAKAAGVRAFGVLEGSSVMGLSMGEWTALNADEQKQKIEEAREVFLAAGADEVILDLGKLVDYL